MMILKVAVLSCLFFLTSLLSSADTASVALAYHTSNSLIAAGQYDSARSVLTHALPEIEATHDSLHAYLFHELLGTSFYNQSQYAKALKHFLQAGEWITYEHFPTLYCRSIINKARIQYALNEKPEAIGQLRSNKGKLEACGNDSLLFSFYYLMGAIQYETSNRDTALQMVSHALSCCRDAVSFKELARAYAVKGEILWVHYEQPDSGYWYFQQAREYAYQSKDLVTMAFANIKLGSIEVKGNGFKEREQYLKTAAEQLQEADALAGIIYVRRIMAQLYSQHGRALDTYKVYDEVWVLHDSIYRAEMRAEVADLRIKYETKEKEEENLKLRLANTEKDLEISEEKQQNQQLLLILFALLVILLAAIPIFIWRKRTAAQQEQMKRERLAIRAMVDGEQKERTRIARDLHDGLGQLLSITRINVNILEDAVEEQDRPVVEKSLQMIDHAIKEVRHVSHALMPVTLVDLGLVPAVEQMVASINETGQTQVTFTHEGALDQLDSTQAILLFRIVQEVTNNMLKHAQANAIDIKLVASNKEVALAIRDNGIGFDISTLDQTKGIGWRNIRSRVELLNGVFQLTSQPGKGTSVYIKIPQTA